MGFIKFFVKSCILINSQATLISVLECSYRIAQMQVNCRLELRPVEFQNSERFIEVDAFTFSKQEAIRMLEFVRR